jgi:hypothetical protein
MYDRNGLMMVQIIDRDRPWFASGEIRGGTSAEVKAAFESKLAYFGSFDVDDAGGIVVHHITGGSFPNWSGTDLVRFFEFSGKYLTLRTPPMNVRGKPAAGYLKWERVGG